MGRMNPQGRGRNVDGLVGAVMEIEGPRECGLCGRSRCAVSRETSLAACHLPLAACRLPTSHRGLPTSDCRLPTATHREGNQFAPCFLALVPRAGSVAVHLASGTHANEGATVHRMQISTARRAADRSQPHPR